MHLLLQTVGWLGWAVGLCFASLLAWKMLKRSKPLYVSLWISLISKLKRFKENVRGLARYDMLGTAVLVAFILVTLVYGVAHYPVYPTEENHNVLILEHPSEIQWWIVSDEHPKGLMYNACDPRDGKWIFVGYYAKRAKWQLRDGCYSIEDAGFEFDYDWKPDGTAKTIEEAGYGRS